MWRGSRSCRLSLRLARNGYCVSSLCYYFAERHDTTDGLNKLVHCTGATVSARLVVKIRILETVLGKRIARFHLPGHYPQKAVVGPTGREVVTMGCIVVSHDGQVRWVGLSTFLMAYHYGLWS
ncbi:hypothetical protein LCGC14_0220210 [marine sediment metagenome]|uniref:Uncharacterized protein n=1 Tax=marine sediment metagenome TaxID=412755 RepID=A0A0F9WXK6_9ZZZZ